MCVDHLNSTQRGALLAFEMCFGKYLSRHLISVAQQPTGWRSIHILLPLRGQHMQPLHDYAQSMSLST